MSDVNDICMRSMKLQIYFPSLTWVAHAGTLARQNVGILREVKEQELGIRWVGERDDPRFPSFWPREFNGAAVQFRSWNEFEGRRREKKKKKKKETQMKGSRLG